MASEKAIRLAYKNMQYHLRLLESSVHKAQAIGAIEKPEGYGETVFKSLSEVGQKIDKLTQGPLATAAQSSIWREVCKW